MPKVSIIVPCYNQAQYLDEALQSVLEQAYDNWECIIINDGSPDTTEEIANQWVKKDSRFIYLKKENGGLSSARNAGITIAQGTYILPLDADDKIAPHYISFAIQSFQENNSLKIVYCKAVKFDEEQGLWELPDFLRDRLIRENVIFCSAMFKKKDWIAVGGYDEHLIYGLEDWEFWIAMLKSEGDVKCLDYVGFFYRIKKISMIKSLDLDQRIFSENYIYTKHMKFFVSNYDDVIESNRVLLFKVKKLELDLKSEKVLINALFYRIFKIKIFKITT